MTSSIILRPRNLAVTLVSKQKSLTSAEINLHIKIPQRDGNRQSLSVPHVFKEFGFWCSCLCVMLLNRRVKSEQSHSSCCGKANEKRMMNTLLDLESNVQMAGSPRPVNAQRF